jgi:hypothetical protein
MLEVQERPDRRRLTRAVGPEEAEDLSLADPQRDVFDAARRAVAFRQVVGFDDWRHGTVTNVAGSSDDAGAGARGW